MPACVLCMAGVRSEARLPGHDGMHGLIACGWAQRPGADQRQTKQQYYARVKAVYDRHQANPITALAPIFIQGPVFVGAFTGLRSLAMHKASHSFKSGVAESLACCRRSTSHAV